MVTDSELTLGLANNVKYLPLTCVIDIVNTKQSFFKRKLNNCVYIFIKQHEAAGRLQAGFYFIELQSSADTHYMNEGHMDTIQTLSCSTKGIAVVSPMGGNQDTFSVFFLSLLPQSDQIGIMYIV